MNPKINFAIVDALAKFIAFASLDGTRLSLVKTVIKKVKTAHFFDFYASVTSDLSLLGQPLFNTEQANNGLLTFPGGIIN